MATKALTLLQRRGPRPDYRPAASRRGYDRAWSRFRLHHLRKHPLCVFAEHPGAKADCLLAASIVDHVKPLTAGGARLDERNCRSVCTNCHAKLTTAYKLTGINEMPNRGREA